MSDTKNYQFASESVSRGHPDKCCDQISDAILDACLAQDPTSKVAVETTTKGNVIGLFGEVTTRTDINYEKIVRDTLRQIGYSKEAVDIDPDTCSVEIHVRGQEAEIAQIVHNQYKAKKEDIGAGDQGLMFGYASDETPEFMPMSLMLAHNIQKCLRAKYEAAREQCARLSREQGKTFQQLEAEGALDAIEYSWLKPDAKSQVVVDYEEQPDGSLKTLGVAKAVLSTQHSTRVSIKNIEDKLEAVVREALREYGIANADTAELIINGKQKLSGSEWTVGGPNADAGTTGRKIIVDTYGGHGAHGGGAFSGKDPSKVDRSAAYYARYVAKSLVAAKLAKRVLVQVSYVIGVPEPLNIHVNSYGTSGDKTDAELLEIVKKNFDFRPGFIVEELDLLNANRVSYLRSAYHGHFGRDEFPWEQPKKLEI